MQRNGRWLATALVSASALVASCTDTTGRPDGAWQVGASDDDTDASLDLQPVGLDEVFTDAADEFDVPEELLKAIAWVETHWHMVLADEEAHPHGPHPAHGIMALRGAMLHEGADLAGVEVLDAEHDVNANIRAAAAWLSAHADELGIEDRTNLSEWAGVVADYSGIEHPLARTGYVHDEVYATLRSGFVAVDAEGYEQGSLDPIEVWPSSEFPPPLPALQPGPDYANSVWRASPNHSTRPGGNSGTPQMVIIHSCEGSYNGCWSWLSNSNSKVSAHYVINANGSEISQLVRENRRAWHIGATYNCNNNSGTKCNLNGVGSNGFTIGIEHAGFASQASWNSNMIHESAKLVCDITKRHGIPRDAKHIVAHGQLQANRTDPGQNWPWAQYIALVNQYCDEGGGGGQPQDPQPQDPQPQDPPPQDPPQGDDPVVGAIIVDSNNANNDPKVAAMAVSNHWVSSASTPNFYGTGYWYASTISASDPATFWFYVDQAGARTVDAWWTEGPNRSTGAPFMAFDTNGALIDVVKVDQTRDGGKWVELGTFHFPAGWNAIRLSRWAPSNRIVVADAVRIR
jgi:N-acetyl-anhydromuramyl-L-alanine amidase AmpD